MQRRGKWVVTGLILAGLLAMLAGPVWAQSPATRIRNAIVTILTVTSEATLEEVTVVGDITAGGDITVTGSIVAASYITTGGDVDIDAGLTATDLTADDDLVVGDDATVTDNATISGTLTVVEQVLATGDVRTGADVQVAQVMRVVPNAAISVTNGAAFTPTGTFQPLTSAGTVTPTLTETDADAGDILILMVTSDTTINLADTGTTKLTAAWAGGQYDTLTLIAEGDNWVELSRTDN